MMIMMHLALYTICPGAVSARFQRLGKRRDNEEEEAEMMKRILTAGTVWGVCIRYDYTACPEYVLYNSTRPHPISHHPRHPYPVPDQAKH